MKNKPVFIIAEAGSNWRMGDAKRDMKMAKTLIDIASDGKADAIKFQTFKAENYVSKFATFTMPNVGGKKKQLEIIKFKGLNKLTPSSLTKNYESILTKLKNIDYVQRVGR